MRAREFVVEGGWETKVTQGTIVTPAAVKKALAQIHRLVDGFNQFLSAKGLEPVEVGHPTGSSAYHDVDPEDKVYGDIDLQMVAPETEHETQSQVAGYWNQLVDEYLSQARLDFVHPDSITGHPIVQIGPEQFVQVDFMWHQPKTREWGRYRVTPERGVKGLLYGNMYSVLGQLLSMSIQHSGVQLKTRGGQPVPFSQRKDTQIQTVSLDINNFIYDILAYLYTAQYGSTQGMQVDPMLKANPGLDVGDIKIQRLVQGVKGLARSFEMNDMYGQGVLSDYRGADDFLSRFWQVYEGKAMADIAGAKRDKAETPEAIARAHSDRQRIMQGLEMVRGLF